MSDDVRAQPPFDDVPTPGDSAGGSEVRSSRFGARPTVWLALLVLVALGVGQSVGFALLFGERLGGLSHENENSSAAPARTPAQTPAPATTAPADEPEFHGGGPLRTNFDPSRHALDVGREALKSGDLQTARVIAASFLLGLDGRSEGDRERESEALALLGHGLATEYAELEKADER